MSDENIEPYTEAAAKRLEHGYQNAIGSLTIDIAEVRESLPKEDNPAVVELLKQAEHCLNRSKRLYVNGGGYND